MQAVIPGAIAHELPDAQGAGAREGQRLEGAFRLRYVDQVLGNSFFVENAIDHFAVTAGAPQPVLHDGAAALGLEEIEIAEHFVVYRERQVVRKGAGQASQLLRYSIFESCIDGKGEIGDLVDGRWLGRLLL